MGGTPSCTCSGADVRTMSIFWAQRAQAGAQRATHGGHFLVRSSESPAGRRECQEQTKKAKSKAAAGLPTEAANYLTNLGSANIDTATATIQRV